MKSQQPAADVGYLFVMISGRKTGKSGGGWGWARSKNVHLSFLMATEIRDYNQSERSVDWTLWSQKEIEDDQQRNGKSEDWSLVVLLWRKQSGVKFPLINTWLEQTKCSFGSFRVFCRRPTMGIVLCLLVSDKPITVVIVGNNIGPEYFPSTATIFNYRRPLTQTARAWKWKIHKAQLQRERVSASLSGNKTPTLSAIRSAWRDSFIILY